MTPPFTNPDKVHRLLAYLPAIAMFAMIVTALGQTAVSFQSDSSADRDPYLSELGAILGRSQLPLEVHLCFAGSDNLSEADVAQGALLAEALALRAGYRPLMVSYGPQLEPEKFNVLIGTVYQLRNLISDQDVKRITNGFLAIQRARGQRNGFYLFVSGRTAGGLESAVLDLGFTHGRLPDSSTSFIPEFILPQPAQFARQAPLEEGKTLTFGQLEDEGATLLPLTTGGLNLSFPGYLRTDSDAPITVRLHLRSAGSVRLKLNGHDVAADQSGQSGNGESEFSIPVRLFQHGRNVLTISAAGSSGSGAEELKIFADSEITTPNLEKGPKLPDLQIVSQTFYPFIGQPDGSNLAILLPERDSETVDAAWTLLSRLAQSANTLFYAAQLSFDRYDSRRQILVIGTYGHLPLPIRRVVSLRAFDEANGNIALADLNANSSVHNLKYLIECLLKQNRDPAEALVGNVQVSQLSQRAIADRDLGLIATAKVPSEGSGWSLVVTAFTQENLLRRVQSLVQPAFWDQIRGDIDRWNEVPGSFQAHVPSEVRETSPIVALEMPFGERVDLWIWVCLICVTLIIYVLVSAQILGRIDRTSRLRPRRPE
jgi:cellulose synthase operon protein B